MNFILLAAAAACFALNIAERFSVPKESAGATVLLKPALAGLALQTAAIYDFQGVSMFGHFNIGVASAHFMGIAVLMLFIVDYSCRFPLSWRITTGAAAVAAVLAILPLPDRELHLPGTAFYTHLVLATLSYACFVLSLAQFVDVRAASAALHSGRNTARLPLLEMEVRAFGTLRVGFAVLSLTLVTGAILSLIDGNGLGRFDHKNLFALLTWFVAAVLLFGRWRYGWRGTTAFRLVASCFFLLALSYLGTRVVLDLLLKR